LNTTELETAELSIKLFLHLCSIS